MQSLLFESKLSKLRMLTIPLSLTLVVVLGQLNQASAQVVHHWRFDPGPDFLSDSVGQAHLEMVGDPVVSTTLPSDGRGVAFPTSFAGSGVNGGSVNFTSARGGLQGRGAELDVEDFTVELFTNVAHFADSTTLVHLVSQAGPDVVPNDGFWSFHIIRDGYRGTAVNELQMVFSYGTDYSNAPSGIIMNESTDYFVAAGYELETSIVTFYVHDLTNRSLRIAHGPYREGGLTTSDHFNIGDIPFPAGAPGSNQLLTDGLIDEIRISRGVLDYSEMLVSKAEFREVENGEIDTITLGPRAIYRVSSTGTSDQISRTSASVSMNEKNVSKFELPEFVDVNDLESATLRLFVSSASGAEGSELELWHSADDNSFVGMVSDFDDPRYLDTQRTVFSSDNQSGQYFDINVTDLVRADYAHDGQNPVAAFRLDSFGGGQYQLSMPRRVERQPLLMLSLDNSIIPGDLNANGVLDANDLDRLSAAIRSTAPGFDLNSDGAVDFSDQEFWVRDLKRTWFGDANLDGQFDSGDLVQVFQKSQYEDTVLGNSTWSTGDWDADGDFTSGDLVLAFQDGGYEQGPRLGARAVPESSSSGLIAFWFVLLLVRGMRHRLSSPLELFGPGIVDRQFERIVGRCII